MDQVLDTATMANKRKINRRMSQSMRKYQTGKFVRVLSYKHSISNIASVGNVKTGVHPSRFLMMFIFCMATMISGMSFTTYTIIADVIKIYYKVSYSTIDLTAMVYVLGYIIPLFPLIWLFEKKGMRIGFLVGTFGTAIGFWITCASFQRNRFWVVILGQTVIGAFLTCFMPLTPQFASVWFGPKELSVACSVGIFFNTLGNALSAVIPPLIVKSRNIDDIGFELSVLGYSFAILASIVAVLALIFFREKPSLPPSRIQALVRRNQEENTESHCTAIAKDVKSLLTNRSFVLHMIAYGIGFSIADATAAILNHLVLSVYPKAFEAVGILGLLIHLPGVPASLLFGIVMDRTHKYKETSLAVYTGALLSFGFFVAGFHLPILYLYLATGLLGFFGAGYLPIGLELGAELTYPVPEVTSSGLLIMSGSIFTLVLTYGAEIVLTHYGVLPAQLIILVFIIFGLVCSFFVKADLNRLKACEVTENEDSDVFAAPMV